MFGGYVVVGIIVVVNNGVVGFGVWFILDYNGYLGGCGFIDFGGIFVLIYYNNIVSVLIGDKVIGLVVVGYKWIW